MMKSLSRWHNNINLYIIYEDINESNLDCLIVDSNSYGWTIHLVQVPLEIERKLDDLPILEHFSKAMYYRLFYPWILKEIDNVLYLDVDLLVRGRLDDLLELDYGNCCYAAVCEPSKSWCDLTRKRLCISDSYNYYNSGVLYIRLDAIRTKYELSAFIDEVINVISDYEIRFPDQDVLNKIFQGEIYELDKKYNYSATTGILRKLLNRSERMNVKIAHFTGRCKPWDKSYVMLYFFQYFRYYKYFIPLNKRVLYWLVKPFYFVKYWFCYVAGKIAKHIS